MTRFPLREGMIDSLWINWDAEMLLAASGDDGEGWGWVGSVAMVMRVSWM